MFYNFNMYFYLVIGLRHPLSYCWVNIYYSLHGYMSYTMLWLLEADIEVRGCLIKKIIILN